MAGSSRPSARRIASTASSGRLSEHGGCKVSRQDRGADEYKDGDDEHDQDPSTIRPAAKQIYADSTVVQTPMSSPVAARTILGLGGAISIFRVSGTFREPTGSDAQDPRSARWRIQSRWRPAASCRRCKRRLRPRAAFSNIDTNVGGAVILRYATRDLVLGIEAVLRRSDQARRRPERPSGAKLADMTTLRLIADDLTGALDTAAEFVGLSAPFRSTGPARSRPIYPRALRSTAARGSSGTGAGDRDDGTVGERSCGREHCLQKGRQPSARPHPG